MKRSELLEILEETATTLEEAIQENPDLSGTEFNAEVYKYRFATALIKRLTSLD